MTLEFLREVRKKSSIPLIIFSGYNPIFHYGATKFAEDAAAAGADGLLIPDLPPEEGGELAEFCKSRGLKMIYLVAPTTTAERRELIARASTGFIYYISLRGVTGARADLPSDLTDNVKALKKITDLPVAVGFGISTPQHARQVASLADGVVVGSALINVIEASAGKPGLREAVQSFAARLIAALRR